MEAKISYWFCEAKRNSVNAFPSGKGFPHSVNAKKSLCDFLRKTSFLRFSFMKRVVLNPRPLVFLALSQF